MKAIVKIDANGYYKINSRLSSANNKILAKILNYTDINVNNRFIKIKNYTKQQANIVLEIEVEDVMKAYIYTNYLEDDIEGLVSKYKTLENEISDYVAIKPSASDFEISDKDEWFVEFKDFPEDFQEDHLDFNESKMKTNFKNLKTEEFMYANKLNLQEFEILQEVA